MSQETYEAGSPPLLAGDVRPQVLVHLWPRAWDEVLPDSELKCTDWMAQRHDRDLRRTIWTAENLDSDNVVEPVITYPLAFRQNVQITDRRAGGPVHLAWYVSYQRLQASGAPSRSPAL